LKPDAKRLYEVEIPITPRVSSPTFRDSANDCAEPAFDSWLSSMVLWEKIGGVDG
jgi:hypothetical protein